MSVWAAKLQYEVRFYGVTDAKLLKALESSSELLLLQERPPATVNGLHYRARADIPKLQKVMKAFAYYDAEIYYEIQPQGDSLQVDLFVHMGPLFHLRSYEIVHGDCLQPLALERCSFCLQELGLKIGERADASSIVRAETAVLNELARCGYPLAYIDKRRVLVDMRDAEVDAAVCVQEGPLAKFGPSTLFGLKSVEPRFIERKIAWREGEPFDLDLVDKTQERLLQTDLFSSVLVSHSEELDEEGELPMKLRLSEAKHRSVGIGFFYATVDGPGGTFTWSNKNLRGMGEQIAIEIDGSERFVGGTATYRKPDFLRFEQTLSFVGEVSREDINPYLAFTYAEANFLERRIDPKQILTLGLKGEYITVHQSANNGVFFLLGLPFTYKYDDSNSPMDPTTGFLFTYAATPFQSLRESNVHFIKQRLVLNFYIPMMENKRVTLALHTEFGSVAGAHQDDVPLPELFLGGSLYDLRGYAYKTVSPLNARGQPLGGRGVIFATAELRLRITETIGIVPFFDCGTVTQSPYPQVAAKWYKSVGAGVRYYTFFGPLRLDVGFPLDPRKGLDTWGKVYASIGQCF